MSFSATTERTLVCLGLAGIVLGIANLFYSSSVAAALDDPAKIAHAHRITLIALAVTAASLVLVAWRFVAFVRAK